MKHGKARVPTPQEFERLLTLESAGSRPARNVAMLMMSFGCGMRVGEIASLNMEDVLNEDGTIKGGFALKAENTKGDKSREVYLSNPKVREALKAYIKHLLSVGDIQLEGPLFMSHLGTRFSANSLQQVFAWMFQRAGLEGCRSHSGRRTFATKLLAKGTDIRSVQVLMGHSNVNQTAEYADTSPETLKRVVSKAL